MHINVYLKNHTLSAGGYTACDGGGAGGGGGSGGGCGDATGAFGTTSETNILISLFRNTEQWRLISGELNVNKT